MLHSIPVLELRSMPQGIVEGYAASFGGIDSYGDTILPGAFAKTLADHAAVGTAPALLWSHEMQSPVGRWRSLEEDSHGLRVAGQLNLKTTAGQQAYEHLQAGDVSGLSIGYTVPAGGAQAEGAVRKISAIQLHEVSLVTLAADPGARVTGVKAATVMKPETLREFQAALQSIGFSRREAARISEKGFAGFTPDVAEIDQPGLRAIEAALRSLQLSLKD